MKKNKKSPYKGIGALEVLEGADNYNNWISKNFVGKLEGPILEIGAGTGNISKHFINLSPFYLTDVDKPMLKKLKDKYLKHKVHVEYFDINKMPPKKYFNLFKSVIGVNVLEHIEKDEKALINLNKIIKNKGKIALLVPAKRWSYTRVDKELGHFRRYEKKELIEKLNTSGFVVEEIYFFNFLGLLSWKGRDILRRDKFMSQRQIKLFDSIVPMLKTIEGMVRPPVGISLIVIARKEVPSGFSKKTKSIKNSKPKVK